MCSYFSINQYKSHLQSYPYISILFASSLRFFTVGILFSFNTVIFLLFLYSLRECYQSIQSSISSCCLSVILSEALLFMAYFWGGFHFSWNCVLDGVILPSSRSLILTITIILASASIITGYAYCLREKAIALGSVCIPMIVCGAELFCSIQISEFMLLEFSINDSVIGCIALTVTSLHFSHVMVGVIILLINFWTIHTQYTSIVQWNSLYLGYSTVVLPQVEYFSLLYWHFVEIIWLAIQFVFYSE